MCNATRSSKHCRPSIVPRFFSNRLLCSFQQNLCFQKIQSLSQIRGAKFIPLCTVRKWSKVLFPSLPIYSFSSFCTPSVSSPAPRLLDSAPFLLVCTFPSSRYYLGEVTQVGMSITRDGRNGGRINHPNLNTSGRY